MFYWLAINGAFFGMRESDVRHEISSQKIKIDSIDLQLFQLDKKLSRRDAFANRESLMATHVEDTAN